MLIYMSRNYCTSITSLIGQLAHGIYFHIQAQRDGGLTPEFLQLIPSPSSAKVAGPRALRWTTFLHQVTRQVRPREEGSEQGPLVGGDKTVPRYAGQEDPTKPVPHCSPVLRGNSRSGIPSQVIVLALVVLS